MLFHFLSIRGTPIDGEIEISFTISGDKRVDSLENIQIHILQVTPLRDNWRMSIGIGSPPGHGATITQLARGLGDGLYFIAGVTSQTAQIGQSVDHSVSGHLWFDSPLTLSLEQAREEVRRKHSEREALATQVLVSDEAPEGSPVFAAIIYYSGVKLHDPFLLRGAEVYGVKGALGVEGIEAPLVADLARVFNVSTSFSESARRDYRAANQLFAVRIFRIRATEIGKAASFALEFAENIATLIATERGEKPKHCATFVGGDSGFSFYPAFQRYRGNLLSPMFSQVHADLIERWQPVVEKSDYARLLVTLFSDAIGERNTAYQYFRCWLVLEQIAKKNINDDRICLFFPNGNPIKDARGNQIRTSGARGKLYQYLITNKWQAFDLQKIASDGRSVRIEGADAASYDPKKEMISLWDAVGAMYSVRNRVAHKGQAAKSNPPRPLELLADRIAGDQQFLHGFLYTLTEWVVWREVEQER